MAADGRSEVSIHTFYAEHYETIDAGGALGTFHRITHRSLERGLRKKKFSRVLEVGANKGEHVRFVRHDFDSYVLSDFRLPAEEIASLDDPRFTYRQADVQHLPFDDDSFDRTIVTCVLHHTSHPGLAAQEIRRVTAPGGVMSILLPCDPGLAYRAAWKNSSGRALRRRGVDDPYLVHAEEHPQHFAGLAAHLRASFANDAVTVRWWPVPIPSWNVNLYTVWHVVKSHD